MEPFDALIDAHGAHVWRVCRALARPEDAADAWQETFLAALRTYGEARPANPRTWLLGIAHHKCMDTHRRRFREAIPIEMDDDARRAWAAPDRVDDGDLWRVVAELPAKQRRVVAYRYLGGLPYAEIAAILGGSVAAARRAGADGIANLRTILKEHS